MISDFCVRCIILTITLYFRWLHQRFTVLQVATSEIYCGMWVRNGLQIKGQAMTYVQCHFCYSMVDADIYLMQVCACKLDPDYFVQTVLDR